jgi:hypothetical protein
MSTPASSSLEPASTGFTFFRPLAAEIEIHAPSILPAHLSPCTKTSFRTSKHRCASSIACREEN